MPRKLTHEQFLNKFYEKNKHSNDIEILGTYINSQTKIKCKCKIDGHEWSVKPNDLLNGHGCSKCAGLAKPTTEEFINKLQQVNPNIEVLGSYKNNRIKIKCKCKIDGYIWEAAPSNLLQGYGCPKCVGLAKPTQEEFIIQLKQINPDIEVLETYINSVTKIKCRCKVCGHEWKTTPRILLNGHGCPKCAGKVQLTTNEFKEKLYRINPDIKVLGTYINTITKIKCKCKICGHEWTTRPNDLLNGHGCPKCSISKGEKRIAQYLDNLGINYVYDKPYFNDLVGTGGRLLRPDFIIPSLKLWIEFDGIQHFKPRDFTGKMSEQQIQEQFKLVQQNDQIKDQYAKANNWTLIRIPFTEYDNIEQILVAYLKQEQVI